MLNYETVINSTIFRKLIANLIFNFIVLKSLSHGAMETRVYFIMRNSMSAPILILRRKTSIVIMSKRLATVSIYNMP